MSQLTDDLQRILDEYPGHQHGFDYAFLSEEESKKIIQEARDTIFRLQGQMEAHAMTPPPTINVYYDKDKA